MMNLLPTISLFQRARRILPQALTCGHTLPNALKMTIPNTKKHSFRMLSPKSFLNKVSFELDNCTKQETPSIALQTISPNLYAISRKLHDIKNHLKKHNFILLKTNFQCTQFITISNHRWRYNLIKCINYFQRRTDFWKDTC